MLYDIKCADHSSDRPESPNQFRGWFNLQSQLKTSCPLAHFLWFFLWIIDKKRGAIPKIMNYVSNIHMGNISYGFNEKTRLWKSYKFCDWIIQQIKFEFSGSVRKYKIYIAKNWKFSF